MTRNFRLKNWCCGSLLILVTFTSSTYGDTEAPSIYVGGIGSSAAWGSVVSLGTCNLEGWSQNYIGIDPADYSQAQATLTPGSTFFAGNVQWFIDAIVTDPGNCNSGNVLVYVVRTPEEVDGSPWTFDNTIQVNLPVGEPWIANQFGNSSIAVGTNRIGKLMANEPVTWSVASDGDLVAIDQEGVLSLTASVLYIPELSLTVTAVDAAGNSANASTTLSVPNARAMPIPTPTLPLLALACLTGLLAVLGVRGRSNVHNRRLRSPAG